MSRTYTHQLGFENSVVYIMHNTYRIKNNFGLHEAWMNAKRNGLDLIIKIFTPVDNNRNELFFKSQTIDLYQELTQFGSVEWITDIDDIKKSAIYIDACILNEEKRILAKVLTFSEECSIYEIDSNTLVPVRVVSDKEEYSARTIRSKIWKNNEYYNEVFVDRSTLGQRNATTVLNDFLDNKLKHYMDRNDPSKDYTSGLSKYLRWGFISPIEIYNAIKDDKSDEVISFLDELVVRRELAYNFCFYNEGYDVFDSMTYDWAYQTMRIHELDDREYLYELNDYLNFRTHDEYFNTAMKELVYFGEMHTYMRMYWGKKIIEWSKNYRQAFETITHLNNYYFLDGNTPNSYAGVAWLFGKHDRAWSEREVFGKLRYMNENGLKRKFEIDKYVDKVQHRLENENVIEVDYVQKKN